MYKLLLVVINVIPMVAKRIAWVYKLFPRAAASNPQAFCEKGVSKNQTNVPSWLCYTFLVMTEKNTNHRKKHQ